MLFFNFGFFHFSKFQMAIVKNLMEKPSFLKCVLGVLIKFYYVTNIFDLHTFDNETTALLNFFEISMEMHFVSLLFLNEKNIVSSLLMIHLKYTVVHYANLDSRSLNKYYLQAVEYAISFSFSISFLCLF